MKRDWMALRDYLVTLEMLKEVLLLQARCRKDSTWLMGFLRVQRRELMAMM
jgi:hypothetical protein